MSREELNELLERLRAEVEALGPDDDEARARLGALVTELEERLADEAEDEAGAYDDLTQGLREAIDRFEVEHPRATGIANRIMVMLSSMGI